MSGGGLVYKFCGFTFFCRFEATNPNLFGSVTMLADQKNNMGNVRVRGRDGRLLAEPKLNISLLPPTPYHIYHEHPTPAPTPPPHAPRTT